MVLLATRQPRKKPHGGGNLVLSRLSHQSITIEHAGERMTLAVLAIGAGLNGKRSVRLSIRAPASFDIVRSELIREDSTSKDASCLPVSTPLAQ